GSRQGEQAAANGMGELVVDLAEHHDVARLEDQLFLEARRLGRRRLVLVLLFVFHFVRQLHRGLRQGAGRESTSLAQSAAAAGAIGRIDQRRETSPPTSACTTTATTIDAEKAGATPKRGSDSDKAMK